MPFCKAWLTTTYGPSFPAVRAQVEELGNQRYLKKIALGAAQYDLRIIAIEKLTDQKTLIRCAQNTEQETGVRIAAIRRIRDPQIRLREAVSVIEDPDVGDYYRVDAIKAVLREYPRAQEELRAVIGRAKPGDALGTDMRAAELLDDEQAAQKIYLRVVLENKYNQMKAMRHLTDDANLLEAVRRVKDGEVALVAASRIGDTQMQETAYREIASADRFDLQHRYDAVMQVDDDGFREPVLREILRRAEALSEQKSGTYVWQDKNMVRVAQECRDALRGMGTAVES